MIAGSAPENAAVAGGSRRAERRQAVILLYQRDVTEMPLADLAENVERAGGALGAFARSLLAGVDDGRESLDEAIAAAAIGWTIDRLAPLERNILRVAAFELSRGEVPPAVAIDEAVRLAKRYCQPEAAGLINGILGRLAREQTGAA